MTAHWYILDKALFIDEVDKMEKEGFVLDADHLSANKEVAFDGAVDVDGIMHQVRFVYNKEFPFYRPNVYLPEKPISEEDQHRTLVDGALCLRGYQPDEWSHEDSGADLIKDIKRWIRSSISGCWENEHKAPDLMVFKPRSIKTVLIPNDLYDITPIKDDGVFEINYHEGTHLAYLHYVKGKKYEKRSLIFESLLPNCRISSIRGVYFSLPKTPLRLFKICSLPTIPYHHFLEELGNSMGFTEDVNTTGRRIDSRYNTRQERRHPTQNDSTIIGIAYPLSDTQRWQFFEVQKGTEWEILPLNTNYMTDFWNRTRGVVDLESLKNSSAAVIGLGSVGSTVALELAAAGIGKLTLIDNDFLTVGNICRHEGSLRHIGSLKTDVLKEIIESKNPFVTINPEPFDVLENRSKLAHIINEVDIVAVCIGNHNIHLYIDSICTSLKKPAVYAFLGPDAVAGRIIRTIPGETGCYNCVQKTMAHYPERYFSLPEIKDINSLPIDYGCNTPAIPGTGFDTKNISLAQTRLVVQTLLKGRGTYPDDSKNIFLITNRVIPEIQYSNFLWSKAWNIPKIPWCSYCSSFKNELSAEQKHKFERIFGKDVAE